MPGETHAPSLAIVLCVLAAPTIGLAEETHDPALAKQAARSWRADIETGYRVQDTGSYQGYYFAPGLWFESLPGLEVGLLVPLHIPATDNGRVGLEFSVGVEPRLRIAVFETLRIDLALGFAGETHEDVEGVTSFGLGLQVGEILNLRYTHERYSLGPEFFNNGGSGDSEAHFLDIALSGRVGERLAYAQTAIFVLLATLTSGAR